MVIVSLKSTIVSGVRWKTDLFFCERYNLVVRFIDFTFRALRSYNVILESDLQMVQIHSDGVINESKIAPDFMNYN